MMLSSERIHRMALDTDPSEYIALSSEETHKLATKVAALETALKDAEAEAEKQDKEFSEAIDEYNSWINTRLHEHIDEADIPKEGKHGKYKVFHTGTGRLAMLVNGYNKLQTDLDASEKREAGLREKYNALIYGVATKYPDETRHETALRYILESESHDHGEAQEALKEPTDEKQVQTN